MWARALLVLGALLSGYSDISAELERPATASDPTGVVLIVLGYVGLALMAVRVTLGATVLAGCMVAATFADIGAGIGLVGLVVTGLVIAKSNRTFGLAYLGFATLWLTVAVIVNDDVRTLWFLLVGILAVSTVAGSAYAALTARNVAAADRISGLEQEVAESLRNERGRIARELHDIVAHHVTMAAMHANVVAMANEAEQRERSLAIVAGSTRQALVELRWMLRLLHTDDAAAAADAVELRLVSSVPAVTHHLDSLGFVTEVELDPTELDELPAGHDVTLSKIFQEATTNVVKHAERAAPVRITARRTAGAVHLAVTNGLRPAAPQSPDTEGMGLDNMRRRAAELGGRVEAGRDGGEWVLRCELPLR